MCAYMDYYNSLGLTSFDKNYCGNNKLSDSACRHDEGENQHSSRGVWGL